MNHSQEEKPNKSTTITTTTSITKLSFVLLTSAVLVLSSIAVAQPLLVINDNAAFAVVNCGETVTDGISEEACSGGGGDGSH